VKLPPPRAASTIIIDNPLPTLIDIVVSPSGGC
jgi:hypothetical protein